MVRFLFLILFMFGISAFATEDQNCRQEPKQDYCQSSGDCPGSQFCRDRGDGIKFCMGGGLTGYYCSSSGDCEGSRFCRDVGDQFMRCVGLGERNDVCSSSGDCNGSLFCRDRGDGLHICM